MSNPVSSPIHRLLPFTMLAPIALATLGGLLLLIVVNGLWTVQTNSQLLRQEQHRMAQLMAKGLSIAVGKPLVEQDYASIEARLLQTAALPGVESALVTNREGEVLGQVQRQNGELPLTAIYRPQTLQPPGKGSHLLEQPTQNQITVWNEIEAGEIVGWVRLRINTQRLSSVVQNMRYNTWLNAMLGALAGFLLLGLAWRRITTILRHSETQIMETQGLLEGMAYYDPLTRLPNRTLLSDRLQQAIARSMRDRVSLAVCFIDLDGFKQVNDQYGHDLGDQLLVEVAHRLRRAVRGGDTVARLGGDEFVVLIGHLHSEPECEQAVVRLSEHVNGPLQLSGQSLQLSCSIGYASFPTDSTSAATLLQQADSAMYQVKQNGGAGVRRYYSEEEVSDRR